LALSYYGSKLSDHITRLDNGCIVCHSVPIARTGTYKYLRSEIGLEGDGVVDVYREPEEVFSDKAIASFNGKAFTDTHPSVDVTADNWSMFSKGEITNVRRGTGSQDDKLIADILVRDPVVINEILSDAKREISSGYTCEYVEEDGKIYQRNIRGNHVALVQAGRAGSEVKIYDEKPDNQLDLSKYHFIKTIDKAIKILN
jgi:hypothetical protein